MRTSGPPETHNRHRISFSTQIKEVIRISDIVLEVLDSRYIEETRNKYLESEIIEQGKILVHVINKADLIDLKTFDREKLKDLSNPVFVSYQKNIGLGKLLLKIKILAKRVKHFDKVHVGIIGYPNTGKSSIINYLAHRKVAHASHQTGLTRGIRKVRLSKGITLLDTPGVLQNDEMHPGIVETKVKHASIGVDGWDRVKDPELSVHHLLATHGKEFDKFYSLENNGDAETMLEILGKKWNFVRKKGVVDIDRTARRILKDWQDGNIK